MPPHAYKQQVVPGNPKTDIIIIFFNLKKATLIITITILNNVFLVRTLLYKRMKEALIRRQGGMYLTAVLVFFTSKALQLHDTNPINITIKNS
jgi:hypothetical protein